MPSSTARTSSLRSRTSAWTATMRRPSSLTSRSVSARSSCEDMGYGFDGMSRQMSTAMMSAPSWASRTAWLRP